MMRNKRRSCENARPTDTRQVWSEDVHTLELREKELLTLYKRVNLSRLGFMNQLTTLWNESHSNLQSTTTALRQQLCYKEYGQSSG